MKLERVKEERETDREREREKEICYLSKSIWTIETNYILLKYNYETQRDYDVYIATEIFAE